MIYAFLQGPPCLIPEFIEKWEKGYRMVIRIKTQRGENLRKKVLFCQADKFYYGLRY